MMRSMYSAISGLRSHQTKMDVIGNNIANVNTVGYKKQTVTFQEVFSQVIRGASAPQDGKGGTNPQQIGLGVDVGAINTIHTQGATQRTDNPEDLMINGEGFFVVTDDTNFERRYYTRAGNFTLDRDGNLVTVDGYKVLGYVIDEDGNITNTVAPIRINKSETIAPSPTTKIEIRGNLDSRAEVGDKHTADTIIKDSLGNSYVVTFEFEKTRDKEWTMRVSKITDQATGNYMEIPANTDPDGTANTDPDGTANTDPDGTNNQIPSVTLGFNEEGKLINIDGNDLTDNSKLEFEVKLTGLDGIKFDKDKDGTTISSPIPPAGSFENILIFDSSNEETYNQLTQYAAEMDAKPYAMDGNSSGTIERYTVDAKGVVYGVFSNGERKALAQLVLAKFDNPMGLQKMGSNLFINSRNSGEPQYGVADSSGFGSIISGSLEMSNVDLAYEFTEMITTQRGFQANSRIITVADEMLQELVNMKR